MDIFMMRNASLRHCRQIPHMDHSQIERRNFYDVISADFTSGCLQEVLLMAINGPYKEFTRPTVYSKNAITKQGNVNAYIRKNS